MEVRFTPDQEAFIRHAIETGRIDRPEDAVREALSLWEERERNQIHLLTTLEEAKASVKNGEGRAVTESAMHKLASEVKDRGRKRVAADKSSRR